MDPNDTEVPCVDLTSMTADEPMFLSSTEMVYNSLSAPINKYLTRIITNNCIYLQQKATHTHNHFVALWI